MQKKSILFQTAPQQMLNDGIYTGNSSVAEIKKHGNFGLGTFNKLAGELIIIDDVVYGVDDTGNVFIANGDLLTPFATVTVFDTNYKYKFNKKLDFKKFKLLLLEKIASKYTPYAIKCHGKFNYLKVRSLIAQNNGPFDSTIQPTFIYQNIYGYLIGYHFPEYMAGINTPGFHFHFIDDNKTKGGHLMDIKVDEIKIALQPIDAISMYFPN